MIRRGCEKQRKAKGAEMLNTLGIPPEAGGGMPIISLTGDKFACIERHNGALQLSPECVRLYSPCGILRIEGKNILVSNMDNECIRLKGTIKSIQFE